MPLIVKSNCDPKARIFFRYEKNSNGTVEWIGEAIPFEPPEGRERSAKKTASSKNFSPPVLTIPKKGV